MKFLLIASYPDSLLHFRGPLLKALKAQGLEVHVAAPGLADETQVCHRLREMGVTVHDIPLSRTGTNPVADLGALLALWRLMRQLRPDVVMAYTIKPVIYGLLAARLAGVPRAYALITGLGYAFLGGKSRGGLRLLVQRLYATALRTADKVFFQNPDDEALFRERGILSESAVTHVVNGSGVDVASFSLAPLSPSPLRFLLIARLLGDKGVREYVAAARLLRARHPDAIFRLVGWIDENPDAVAQSELDAWIAEGVIEFLGRLSDVRPAIADCSVYVLPSYREGTPRTVLEAMAMGRPVITTDAPGCRETVVDGDNGFLVPVKGVVELAAAMEKFALSPELVLKMGQRSRAMAESKYDVNAVNAVMLEQMGISGKSNG